MMKKQICTLLYFLVPYVALWAQPSAYQEATNPTPTDGVQWQSVRRNVVGWGSTDTRYEKELPVSPGALTSSLHLTAWRGEKVSAQCVLSTPHGVERLHFRASALRSGSNQIATEHLQTAFVRYVMTDELNKDGKGACGERISSDFDSTLVADVLDHLSPELKLPAQTTQCGWLSVRIPSTAKPGVYKGAVDVCDGSRVLARLPFRIEVKARTLPSPADWHFHLDLWQNPYAVARYHEVALFSPEHFDLMRPLMQMYADAGGKVITASIIHKPWNGQTYDPFESMVTCVKKAAGEGWWFDYTVFDKWVEFMMSLGVKAQINCYSMIPWRLSFQYFDQASNTFQYLQAKPGDSAYEDFWVRMLQSFAAHLKAKGWFGITHIAMDERPLKDMQAALAVIRKADKDFKVSLAGTHHPELIDQIDDYCIGLLDQFTPEEIARRRAIGRVTTFYTCCAEPFPNTFTFSSPVEAEWLMWHAAREGLDGYLRWAYNSWVAQPLRDSRFRTWAAGDTYLVYPGARSSIRFERMVEGIQGYEKVRMLKDELKRKGDVEGVRRIDEALQAFDEKAFDLRAATEAVRQARRLVNGL